MSKVEYISTPDGFCWQDFNPFSIVKSLFKQRELIAALTIQNFRTTYQASYLGAAWQIILPLIMLFIFYFVFGVILGGKFSHSAIESPLDYALALFVGLSFFNFISQNISLAPSLIISNPIYVKNLSFPLEVVSVVNVFSITLNLMINLLITVVALLIIRKGLPLSAVLSLFYIGCVVMLALGISWGLSALAVFVRDISALISPLTLILMFMCPIFYSASMVPSKIQWIIAVNPLALIIDDARNILLYGTWPTWHSMVYVFLFSLSVLIAGHCFFIRMKHAFADVI